MKTLITVSQPDLKRLLFPAACLDKLTSVSELVWIEENKPYTIADLAREIGAFDACITGWGSPKITEEVVRRADKLRWIGHTAGTVIPVVDACVFQRGITVVNANACLAQSTAELAVALMLAAAWKIPAYAARMGKGGWSDNNRETVPAVARQHIGIIGYGVIAREVIRLLRPFEAEIRLFSRHCSEAEARVLGVRLTGLDELLQNSRIVTLHNTLTSSSRGMLGERELALMPDGALLVNTARALIVQGQALLRELESGRLSAALDVFEAEPLPVGHPFQTLPNVLCTPHIGGFAAYWKNRLGESVADDLLRFLRGEEPLGKVTAEQFRSMTPR